MAIQEYDIHQAGIFPSVLQDISLERADLDQIEEKMRKVKARLKSTIVPETSFGPVIYASEDPKYFRPFTRDTIISEDLLEETEFTDSARDAVLNLWRFQGSDGKIPHEVEIFDPSHTFYSRGFYRKYQTQEGEEFMLNEDSVDATPLLLIRTAEDTGVIENIPETLQKKIRNAFSWMFENMDSGNGYLSYSYKERGKGLIQQGWMDSDFGAGVMREDGSPPPDPISLVEVQGYAWKAMKVWADKFEKIDENFSEELIRRANALRVRFNHDFLIEDEKGPYFAHAIDGLGKAITKVSLNPGLCLWASFNGESIIGEQYVEDVVRRLTSEGFLRDDMGIHTFEDGQTFYDSEGYHDGEGVYWPAFSYLVAKGFERMGYHKEAERVLRATNRGIENPVHGGNYIEQFHYRGGNFGKFARDDGDRATKNQTWTMAGYLWGLGRLKDEKIRKESEEGLRFAMLEIPEEEIQTRSN